MNEFSDKVHKLQHDFKHSPWSEWANRKKAEKDAFFEEHTIFLPEKEPPEYLPMTEAEKEACRALEKCTYFPSSFEKRFARSMANQVKQEIPQMTARQRNWLWQQVYRYRRQIKNRALISFALEMKKANP